MRTIRYFCRFAKRDCENVCLWYSNKKLFAMETLRIKPTGVFFEGVFGRFCSILYAQSEKVKNICFFVKKEKGKCLIEKRQLIQKFSGVKEILPEHKKILEALPDEILLEELWYEEEYDSIE